MGIKDFIKAGWKDSEQSRAEKTKETANRAAFVGFSLLSMADWITPLVGIVESAYHDVTPTQDNSWTFFVSYPQAIGRGCNANDIDQLMRDAGINSWGRQVMPLGDYMFTVSREDARRAEDVLLRNGIPLRYTDAPDR